MTVVEWLAQRHRKKKKPEASNLFLEAPPVIHSDLAGVLCELAFNPGENRLIFDEAEVVRICGQKLAEEAIEVGYLVAEAPFYGNAFSLSAVRELKISFAHKTIQEFFAAIQIIRKLEAVEDVQSVIGCRLESQREVVLFAIGIAYEAKSQMINKLLGFVLQFVRSKLRSIVVEYDIHRNAIRHLGNDDAFILSFLKALFREMMDDNNRKALKHFVNENSADFERFTAKHFASRAFKPRALLEIAQSLFPLGVGFQAFQAVSFSGHHFVLSRMAYKRGQVRALEIAAAVAGILETPIDGNKVDLFHFEGTLMGLSSFLNRIGIRSDCAYLTICKSSLRLPTEITTQGAESETLKMVNIGNAAKSACDRIRVLELSSHFDASEVRNLLELLSRIASFGNKVEIERLWFDGDEMLAVESGDSSPGATNVIDLLASNEPTSISVNTLYARGFTPKAISNKSMFAELLFCVQKIDCIEILDNGLPLIDEFLKLQREYQLAGRMALVRKIVVITNDLH